MHLCMFIIAFLDKKLNQINWKQIAKVYRYNSEGFSNVAWAIVGFVYKPIWTVLHKPHIKFEFIFENIL